MMFYVLIVVALLIVAGEFYFSKANKRTRTNGAPSRTWLLAYRWRWLVGIPFAIGSAYVYYPMSNGGETYKVMGFPLFVAAFDAAGSDYVGPFTTPFFIGNAIIWYFLPNYLFSGWALYAQKRSNHA